MMLGVLLASAIVIYFSLGVAVGWCLRDGLRR